MVQDWPSPNSLAWLRLPCCDAEHPTRVEDFIGDDCVVATPLAPHTQPIDPDSVRDGFFLGWVVERGALEVPVELVTANHEPVPTWRLKALGPGIETQRRSFVRLTLERDVNLYLLEGGAPTEAKMLDLSEGGLRCRVDNWALDPGSKVFSVQLSLETRDYYLRSQMAWRGNPDTKGNRELGIRFTEIDPSTSDSIRSYIFAAQLAERRKLNQL